MHTWVQKSYPVLGLGSGERLLFGDREGTTKKLCDKDSAERSGELSGAIRLKTLVLLDNDW